MQVVGRESLMLRIDRRQGRLAPLGRPELEPAALLGRHRLDELIASSPAEFFREIRRPLLLLGRLERFYPRVRRASDFLAVDPAGRTVIVAVQQPGAGAPDLVEALESAEVIARLRSSELLERAPAGVADAVRAHLKAPPASLNAGQGVLLLAEQFDSDTLATSAWLRQRYGLPVDCVRVGLAVERGTADEYLVIDDMAADAEALHLAEESETAPWPEAAPDISDHAPGPVAVFSSSELKPFPESKPFPEPAFPEPEARQALPGVDEADEAPTSVETPPAAQVEQPEEPEIPVTAERLGAAEPSPDWEAEFQAAISEETGPLRSNGAHEDAGVEDPLAEIIAARERAAEAESETREDNEERRGAERSSAFQARRLRLNYFGRLLGARLVDFSNDGLGVEALSPLPVGAEIGVSGELVAGDKVIGLEGRARVRHCKSSRDGVCRIGFSIDPNAVKELNNPETFDRR